MQLKLGRYLFSGPRAWCNVNDRSIGCSNEMKVGTRHCTLPRMSQSKQLSKAEVKPV